MKTLKHILVVASLLLLAACKQTTIEAPTNNFSDNQLPDLFKVVFTGGAPSELALQLNASIVTELFTVTDTEATASGSQLTDYIYPGRNVFRVVTDGKAKQVFFYYDVVGPKIHILDVDHDAGTVEGYAEDSSGVASLVIDGASVDVDSDGYFQSSFISQSVNTIIATDGYGYTSTSQFARKDNNFTGISARLNQGGLDFLLAVLEQELTAMDFGPILRTLPDTRVSLMPGVNLTIRATEFDLNLPDIDLQVQDDETVDAHIELVDFVMGIRVWGNIFLLPFASGADVYFERFEISTTYLMDIIDSDLSISLANTDYALEGLRINLHIIPSYSAIDAMISNIANSLITAFEPMIVSIAEGVIIPIVSDFIKDIPIDLQITIPGDQEKINVSAVPEFLDSKDLGMTVDLNTRIWAPEPNPDVPGQLGSLYVPGSTPSLGATTISGQPFDFGAAINSNVINQALFAAHEAGVTTMAIHPNVYANATPEGIEVYSPSENEIVSGDAIGMRIEPASPPFVKFMPADQAAGVLGWYDVSLSFDLYKPEWGEYRTLFGVTFNLEVPFEIGATQDGFLSIGVEQLPTIFITATDSSGLLLLPPSFINSTLDYFMPAVLPRLAEELKIIPLPRIYNHSLYMREFWIAGEGNNSLALAGDLVPYGVTESAPEPATVVDYTTASVNVNRDKVSSSGSIETSAVTVNNGEVNIDVDGINPQPELGSLEHRYRVDGGGWSVWKRRSDINLSRMLAGDHEVEVCSRTVLLKKEIACPSVQFETSLQ